MENIMNHPVYVNFVSPDICRRLCLAGLDTNTKYKWVIKANQKTAELRTFAFDEDHYYKIAWANVDFVSPPFLIIPAYQINDMEKLLPDFYLSRVNTEFTICIDSNFKVEPVSNKRLPDAFAFMVIDCISSRILRPAMNS